MPQVVCATFQTNFFLDTDYDECKDFSYDCPMNATCLNSNGSYSCECPAGYRFDGKNCTGLVAFL